MQMNLKKGEMIKDFLRRNFDPEMVAVRR